MDDDAATEDLRRLIELEDAVRMATLRLSVAKEGVKEARAALELAKQEQNLFYADLRTSRPLFARKPD